MTVTSVGWIMVATFIGVLAVHQMSRVIMGKRADNYPGGIVVAAGYVWYLSADTTAVVLTLIAGVSGHLISVHIARTERQLRQK